MPQVAFQYESYVVREKLRICRYPLTQEKFSVSDMPVANRIKLILVVVEQ